MSSLLKLVLPVLLFAIPVVAQPSIGGVVNGASYATAPDNAKNTPIGNNLVGQGAIFVIFGKNMGPATLAGSTGLPLTTTLPASGGTSVSITSGGKTVSAYMVYTSAGQVAAILPSDTPIGAATVTVTYNGQTSAAANINVVASGLGVFTNNSQGNGPAIAQVYHVGSTTAGLVALTNSAQPGDTLIVYGTGLGAIPGADNTAPGAVSVGTNVMVNIAGTAVTPLYAGRSPDFPGLDQINFKLPANVATGCYIPAEITATGQPSNQFYLSIASSGSTTCTHPFGLSQAAMAKLDSGGSINIGLFLLLSAVELGVAAEGAGGLFDVADANTVFQMYSRIVFAFGGTNFPVATGSCAIMDTTTPYDSPSVPNLAALGGTNLNAGGAVTVTGTGPVGTTGIPALTTGGYETVFFEILGQGQTTLTGTGGPDVGAFTAMTTLPADLVWTNVGNLASPPRTGITVTWSGGSINAQSLVTAYGSSVVINPTDPSKNRGKQFFCNAPASAGMFMIPASILQQLPSDAALATGEMAFGALGINTGGGSSFTAPLTKGTLDAGYLAFGEAQSISVTYQ
jgi:uncharacterized protein (TIGR03437 family)